MDKTIRCNGYRILYGASNSGIGALYALLSGRLPCQAYIISSPMLGWSPNLMSKALEIEPDNGWVKRLMKENEK